MSPVFQRFPQNDAGRDFVLGDIHGAYDMVIQGMRQVKFDRKIDRLFSVGDLIDRGPDSHRALKFLLQPYVHATRGNHDHDFSTLSLSDIRTLGGADWNGMKWVLDASDENLLAIQAKFAQLPIAIEVSTPRGSVGLVHGDVPAGMDWPSFIDALEHGDERVTEVALTGRARIQARDGAGVAGIGRVFVGHTIQWDGPKRLGNVYAIDTGAVFHELNADRGALTMVNMVCRTGVLAPAPADSLRNPVVTHPTPGAGPFGAYAAPRRRAC